MNLSLTEILRASVLVVLGIEVLKQYLIVNKIWIRKHERAVAESVSVIACLITFVTTVPYLVDYIHRSDVPSAIGRTMTLIVTGFWFAIGIGLWVPGWSARGTWQSMKKALRIERGEWTDSLRSMRRHGSGERILEVLERFAMVDRELAPIEARILRSFAAAWGLPEPTVTISDPPDYAGLRRALEDYLRQRPPQDQAAQLADLLRVLAEADGRVTPEERIALGEVEGLLHDYLDGDAGPSAVHEVLVAPQDENQERAFLEIHPEARPVERCGGRVYSVGNYHHAPYAELVSSQYRERRILSFVHAAGPAPRGETAGSPGVAGS